jgi:hypothetical protein
MSGMMYAIGPAKYGFDCRIPRSSRFPLSMKMLNRTLTGRASEVEMFILPFGIGLIKTKRAPAAYAVITTLKHGCIAHDVSFDADSRT